jgi:hypothetical protein
MTNLLRLVAFLFLSVSFNSFAQSSQFTLCNTTLNGAYIVAQDSSNTYLGFFGNEYASESIMNSYGSYGSPYATTSVRNDYSQYGSAYGLYSPNNPYSSNPPLIIKSGQLIGYLTNNSIIAGGISLSTIDSLCSGFVYSFTAAAPLIGPANTPAIYDVTYVGDLSIGSILSVNVIAFDPDGTTNLSSNGLCSFIIQNNDLSTYDTIYSPASICAIQINNDYAGKTIKFLFVFDDDLGNDEASLLYTIGTINSLPNQAPVITSTPNTSAIEDVLYSYTIIATDPNGDSLFITGTTPNWLTLNGNTISGTPSNEHVGSFPVTIILTDPDGLSDTQTFTLTVSNTNDDATYNFPAENCGIYAGDNNSSTYEGTIYENTIINVGAEIRCGYAMNPNSSVGLVRFFDDIDGVTTSLENGILEYFTYDQDNGYVNKSFTDELKGPTVWLNRLIIDESMQGKDLYYQFKFTDDFGNEEISQKYFIGSILISEEVNVPAMGGIGLLALGLSMLGLGAVRMRKK